MKPSATKSATTYTPTTTNQTIASGTYCSGTQTIKGDSNLVASNIKSGVSIFGVAGSYTGNEGGASSGGSSSGETCQVCLSFIGTTFSGMAYSNGSSFTEEYFSSIIFRDTYITVLKNSLIYLEYDASIYYMEPSSYGNCNILRHDTTCGVLIIAVSGDGGVAAEPTIPDFI